MVESLLAVIGACMVCLACGYYYAWAEIGATWRG